MRRVLAAVLVIPAAAFAACGSSEEEHSLTFTSPSVEVEAIDEADKGPSRGDFRAFTQELFEEGSEEPAGRLDGTVTITDVDELDGTQVEYRAGEIQFSLDGGNIVAVGNYIAEPGEAVPAEGGVDRPIVGGTGAYKGARGEVTATAVGEDGFRFELAFETPSE